MWGLLPSFYAQDLLSEHQDAESLLAIARDVSSRSGCSFTACHTFKEGGRETAGRCSSLRRSNFSGGISSPLGWNNSTRWKATNDHAVLRRERQLDSTVFVACLCNCKEGLLQNCKKTWSARDLLFCLLQSLTVSAA